MKKKIFMLARIAVAVILLIYLFTKIDIIHFWDTIMHADYLLILAGLSLYFIIAVLAIMRWQFLLAVHNVKPPFLKLAKLFFIGLFFNNAMPGLTGGDIVKGYYVAKETKRHKPEAVTTVFIDRIVGVAALLMIGIIALAFNLDNLVLRKLAEFIMLLFALMIVFLPIIFSKRIMKRIPFLNKFLDILPFKEIILRIYHTFYKYKSHFHVIVLGIILSIILQGIYIIMVYMLGISIGLKSVGLINYFMFIPIISTIAALPVSVSGLGVNEQLYVYCFGIVGGSKEGALAIALMARLVLLIWSIPGWFFYMAAGNTEISEDQMKKEIADIEKQI